MWACGGAFLLYGQSGREMRYVGLATKGGLALPIFDCQFINVLHVGVLDLDADELWSSDQRFPLIDAWCYWISRAESIR
jgi:hypothetical protein